MGSLGSIAAIIAAFGAGVIAQSFVPQARIREEPTTKEIIVRVINIDEFPNLDRASGSRIRLQKMAGNAVEKEWTSSPIEFDGCLGICSIPDVPSGEYRLKWSPLGLETKNVVIPAKPVCKLQIRIGISRVGLEIQVIDTIPDRFSGGESCLIVGRIHIDNSEPDLDELIGSAIEPFLQVGRPFRAANLDRAIEAVNKLGLFLTLSRDQCRLTIPDSSDIVHVWFPLRPR